MQTHASSTYLLLLLVIGHVWVVSGCGGDTSTAGEVPMHHHVVCVSRADGQTESCANPDRASLFNSWVTEAIHRPHSTFSIWIVGPARHHYRHVFTACIPTQWPASVWKSKADFIMRSRKGMSSTQQGLVVPDDCRPPESKKTPGIHQLTVRPADAPFMGDVLRTLVLPPEAPPLHFAIACDRSDSTLGATCTPAALLRVFDLWVAEALAQPGASLSVEMIGPLQDSLRSVYDVTVPDLSIGERIAFVLGARSELGQLLDGSGEKYASTIAEAISATVRRLRERQGRYRLVVLSDLLQLTSGVWNFNQAVPSPDDFLAWLKSTQLAADLGGIPVLACGVHTGHFGSYSQAHSTQVHSVWEAALEGMGAPEVKLFSSCEAGFASL